MKATGITRRIDELGRLIVPRDIQQQLGYKEGMQFELFILEDKASVMFTPVYPGDALTPMVSALKNTLELNYDLDDENYEAIHEHIKAINQLLEDLKAKGRDS